MRKRSLRMGRIVSSTVGSAGEDWRSEGYREGGHQRKQREVVSVREGEAMKLSRV